MTDKMNDEKLIKYIFDSGLQAVATDRVCKKNAKQFKDVMNEYFSGKTLKEICDERHIDFYKIISQMESSNVYHSIYPLPSSFKPTHIKYVYLNYGNRKSKYYHVMPKKLVQHIDNCGIHKNDGYIVRAMWLSKH